MVVLEVHHAFYPFYEILTLENVWRGQISYERIFLCQRLPCLELYTVGMLNSIFNPLSQTTEVKAIFALLSINQGLISSPGMLQKSYSLKKTRKSRIIHLPYKSKLRGK